ILLSVKAATVTSPISSTSSLAWSGTAIWAPREMEDRCGSRIRVCEEPTQDGNESESEEESGHWAQEHRRPQQPWQLQPPPEAYAYHQAKGDACRDHGVVPCACIAPKLGEAHGRVRL